MRRNVIGPSEKCKYCGLDAEHCVCGAQRKPVKIKIARAPKQPDACEIDSCGGSCSCSKANHPASADEESGEREEHRYGGFEGKQIVAIGGAIVLLAGSMFLAGWLQIALRICAYLLAGYEVLLRAGTGIVRRRFFDENVLMSVATIGAIVLGDYTEAAAVMIFYGIGETLQEAAVRSSRKRIADAVELHPDKARRIENGRQHMVRPEDVAVGETILVKAGERIPLDGEVVEGESLLDVTTR